MRIRKLTRFLFEHTKVAQLIAILGIFIMLFLGIVGFYYITSGNQIFGYILLITGILYLFINVFLLAYLQLVVSFKSKLEKNNDKEDQLLEKELIQLAKEHNMM